MSVMMPQITSLTNVYSTDYSGVNQRKHQSSVSLAFVRGIHQWLMNSPHKGPVTWNMFPFDDIIMWTMILMSCHMVKSLQIISRSGTRRLTLWGPYLQISCRDWTFNTLRPRRNGQHFPDNIFKHIFFNENVWISIKSSLKFVPKGPINNIALLVQIMACRLVGAKPLSELMMVMLPMHICVTRPLWVKKGPYDTSSSNGHQGDILYSIVFELWESLTWSIKGNCCKASNLIVQIW